MAKCFSAALQIAIDNQMEGELMQLALQCSESHVKDVAMYFESKEQYENAIALYARAKLYSRAVDLCLKTQDFNQLESIMRMLDPQENEALIIKLKSYIT